MRHLTPDELIDLAEGAAPDAVAPHLQACETCRRSLADLQAARRAAADVEVPEPSPLFWDHFSARIGEAVAAERDAAAGAGSWSWARLLTPLSALAVAALVLAIGLAWRSNRPPPAVPTSPAVAANVPVTEPDTLLRDDPSLDLVADLSRDLDYDTAHDAGFVPHGSGIDAVVLALSDAERVELRRLLTQEMARPGA